MLKTAEIYACIPGTVPTEPNRRGCINVTGQASVSILDSKRKIKETAHSCRPNFENTQAIIRSNHGKYMLHSFHLDVEMDVPVGPMQLRRYEWLGQCTNGAGQVAGAHGDDGHCRGNRKKSEKPSRPPKLKRYKRYIFKRYPLKTVLCV